MSGPRSGRVVELTGESRDVLEALTRRTTVTVGLARRARIVLLAAEGVPLDRIGRQVGVDRNVVRLWVDRSLEDRPRPGRPRTFSPCGGPAPGAASL